MILFQVNVLYLQCGSKERNFRMLWDPNEKAKLFASSKNQSQRNQVVNLDRWELGSFSVVTRKKIL